MHEDETSVKVVARSELPQSQSDVESDDSESQRRFIDEHHRVMTDPAASVGRLDSHSNHRALSEPTRTPSQRQLSTGNVCGAATADQEQNHQPAAAPSIDGSDFNLGLRSDSMRSRCFDERKRKELPTSVVVTGLTMSNKNTELLQKYFSVTSRSGGGTIQQSYWDQQAFVIIFGSNKPVERVISRTHERCGIPLKVIPVTLDNVDDLCRTFSVACVPEEDLSCTLNNYLCDVGVRGQWQKDETNRRIVVTVSSAEDIQRVKLETDYQNEVEFEGRRLILTKMKPISWVPWVGKAEDNAVFFPLDADADETTVHRQLSEYFQPWCRESDNTVVKITAGKTGRHLVHFEKCIDFRALRRWVQQHPFKAEIVAVEQVEASTCIRVSNFCQLRTEHCRQEIADHFASVAERYLQDCEDKDKRQDEVNDDGIEIFPDENYVTVKFHCRRVLDRVLGDESCTKFQGSKLDVSLHYDM